MPRTNFTVRPSKNDCNFSICSPAPLRHSQSAPLARAVVPACQSRLRRTRLHVYRCYYVEGWCADEVPVRNAFRRVRAPHDGDGRFSHSKVPAISGVCRWGRFSGAKVEIRNYEGVSERPRLPKNVTSASLPKAGVRPRVPTVKRKARQRCEKTDARPLFSVARKRTKNCASCRVGTPFGVVYSGCALERAFFSGFERKVTGKTLSRFSSFLPIAARSFWAPDGGPASARWLST